MCNDRIILMFEVGNDWINMVYFIMEFNVEILKYDF